MTKYRLQVLAQNDFASLKGVSPHFDDQTKANPSWDIRSADPDQRTVIIRDDVAGTLTDAQIVTKVTTIATKFPVGTPGKDAESTGGGK